MKSKWMFLCTLLILASFILSPVAPAFAQDEQPPKPPVPASEEQLYVDPDPELSAQGLVNHGDLWANEGGMIVSADDDSLEAQASLSKPDKYGYRYQKVAVDWIDVYSEGTPIDREQFGYGGEYVHKYLPFPFKFYGYIYDELQISQYGYLNMGWDEWQTDDQSPIGSPARPNNIIAPNWQPIYPNDYYEDSTVYVLSGGEEPNRWYAIEWHNFVDDYYYDGVFTFEVVLHENGEILFQYDTMDYPSSYWCGSAGIEDRDGLVYLSTFKFCNRQTSYSAVKIIPPAPTARLAVLPSVSGKLGAPGQVIEHYLRIYNQGELGEDVFDLTYKGKWPATLNGYDYGVDDWVPLTDTDGDKRIDTGTVAPHDLSEILVRIIIPASAKVGSRYDSTITAASSINKKKTIVVTLENAVAASFAQTYTDGDGPVIKLSDQNEVRDLRLDDWGDYPQIVETSSGRLIHFMELIDCLDEECEVFRYDIKLTILEHDGTIVRSGVSLAYLFGVPSIEIGEFGFAAGPYGTVGITYAGIDDDGVSNVYYIVIDDTGGVVGGPFNVTKNTVPMYDPDTEERTGPRYVSPRIALTATEAITIVWRTLRYEPNSTSDVFYRIMDDDGATYTEPIKLTNAVENVSYFTDGTAQTIMGNKTMLAWSYWLRTGKPGKYKWTYYIQYQVIESYGKVLKKPTTIKAGDSASGLDTAQMSSGEIVLSWMGSSKGKGYVYYAIVSGKTLKKTKGPTQLKYKSNPPNQFGISIATDWSGNAIVTWQDNNNQAYYALLGKNGAIKTKPMIYKRADQYSNLFATNGSSSSYGLRRPVNVTITVTVPKTTDATGKGVFLVGNFNGWDPAGTPMTRVDKTHWKVTIAGLPEGYPLLYKYTLGSWEDVEKGKKCVEINDRVLDLAFGATGAMKKSDTVANWRSVLPCTGE